jgi:hypothetical protein
LSTESRHPYPILPLRLSPACCRTRQTYFESKEQLDAHRETAAHVVATQKDRAASTCVLCCKSFTSAVQLVEHVKGKWHQVRCSL